MPDARRRYQQANTAVVADDHVPVTVAADLGLRPFDELGAYQLLKRLGGGGMAEVYLARARLSAGVEKLVALKTTLPRFGPETQLGALFLTEARISATLQHSNLVNVFDFGEAAGRPYLSMELLQGRDLGAVLTRAMSMGKTVPPGVAVAIAVELCRALEYVHDKRDLEGKPLSLVHRDLNPPNVFLCRSGEVKLMDFGVVADAATGNLAPTAGKAAYCCSEQLEGKRPSPDWDLYAVGVVLRELLTLETEAPLRVVAPSQLAPSPPQLDDLILRATHGSPAARFTRATELRLALEPHRGGAGSTAISALLSELFPGELEAEQVEVERLFAEGRRRRPDGGAGRAGWLKPLRVLRRRVASSRFVMRLARHRGAVTALALVVLGALGAGGVLGWRLLERREALATELRLADRRAAQGRLAGAGQDEALEHLLAAQRLAPGEPAVRERLGLLAARLEALGDAALERGDLVEAVVHFDAALQAEPGRRVPREKLAQIEARAREEARARLQQKKR